VTCVQRQLAYYEEDAPESVVVVFCIVASVHGTYIKHHSRVLLGARPGRCADLDGEGRMCFCRVGSHLLAKDQGGERQCYGCPIHCDGVGHVGCGLEGERISRRFDSE
jgi:hypothetical protein